MIVDGERVAGAIAEVVRTEIMPRFGSLAADEVREKSSASDLVTIVDERAELRLRALLHDIAPDARFIGEESAAGDPTLERDIARGGAFWIVDPLDGTRNFVRGVREFGTIVALVVDGETRAGWIYAAPDASCLYAERGRGAWLDRKPVSSAPQTAERLQALRSLGWLEHAEQAALRMRLAANFSAAQNHCSAYGYRRLALGEVDLKISSRIHPWDHVAGALILEELGGRVAWLDGGAPYLPSPSRDRALLATAPGRDWNVVAGLLRAD